MFLEVPKHVTVEDWGLSRPALECILGRKDGCQMVTWGALLGGSTSSTSRVTINDSRIVSAQNMHGQEAERLMSEKYYQLGCHPKGHGTVWRNT